MGYSYYLDYVGVVLVAKKATNTTETVRSKFYTFTVNSTMVVLYYNDDKQERINLL